LPIIDESLVVDDLLANSDFETFASGSFTNWTLAGASATDGTETTIVFHGAQSAKIGSASATAQIYQDVTINVKEITSRTVLFKMWVYATVADVARIRLDWDGSNFASSPYHTANDQWELLSVEASVPSSATKVRAICEVATGSQTAYFDAGWLAVDSVSRYTLPTTIINGPQRVSEQVNPNDANAPYYPLPPYSRPRTGRRLRLEGMGLLTRPTTETGTTEVDGARVNLIVAYAAHFLFRMQATKASGSDRDYYNEEAQRWFDEAETLRLSPGIAMRSMSAEKRRGTWHTEEDAAGRYLVFDRRR
jgi:hypothetical protein